MQSFATDGIATALSDLDETHAIQRSRISVILRGGYIEISAPEEPGGDWLAQTPEPSIVNELRVRCVDCELVLLEEGVATKQTRAVPAFTLSGGNEGSDKWVPICSSDGESACAATRSRCARLRCRTCRCGASAHALGTTQ